MPAMAPSLPWAAHPLTHPLFICRPSSFIALRLRHQRASHSCPPPAPPLSTHRVHASRLPAVAVVIEGMGRAVHTNYFCRLQCDSLKLAMIKNKHLAQSLFDGDVYDCVCRFDEGQDTI